MESAAELYISGTPLASSKLPPRSSSFINILPTGYGPRVTLALITLRPSTSTSTSSIRGSLLPAEQVRPSCGGQPAFDFRLVDNLLSTFVWWTTCSQLRFGGQPVFVFDSVDNLLSDNLLLDFSVARAGRPSVAKTPLWY